MAVSLGYSETLMSCPAASTSSEMPEGELVRAGIAPGLVRLSIGYTGTLAQRWQQLRATLVAMGLCA
jgi:methionine-gamma-lyase